MRGRFFLLALFLLAPSAVRAERLDRERVAALAAAQAPLVTVMLGRLGEARAWRVGASAPIAPNPEIGLALGPRALPTHTIVDVVGSLIVPIDVSGASGLRQREADERVRLAELELANARRVASAEAVDAWLLALGAEARVALARERAKLDEGLWSSAESRRRAGTIGDLDLQLAAVVRAEGTARLRRAEGDAESALVILRARTGLPAETPVELVGTLEVSAPPPLAALLVRLATRADLASAALAVEVGALDERLQHRLGVPPLRLTASGGRDNELFGRFGVETPLPIYQRNQTARAVAAARRQTLGAERERALAVAEAELRAAYASFRAEQQALAALDDAGTAMRDAEHLATRAYELGQSTLANLVVARREAASARAAHLEARLAVARARAAIDAAVGGPP